MACAEPITGSPDSPDRPGVWQHRSSINKSMWRISCVTWTNPIHWAAALSNWIWQAGSPWSDQAHSIDSSPARCCSSPSPAQGRAGLTWPTEAQGPGRAARRPCFWRRWRRGSSAHWVWTGSPGRPKRPRSRIWGRCFSSTQKNWERPEGIPASQWANPGNPQFLRFSFQPQVSYLFKTLGPNLTTVTLERLMWKANLSQVWVGVGRNVSWQVQVILLKFTFCTCVVMKTINSSCPYSPCSS